MTVDCDGVIPSPDNLSALSALMIPWHQPQKHDPHLVFGPICLAVYTSSTSPHWE